MIHSMDFSESSSDFGGDWYAGHEDLGHWKPDEVYSPWAVSADGFVGTPNLDSADWVHQTTPFTCAVVSQQMILKEFGVEVSEAQLVYDATSHGWLHSGGTSPNDVGRLLESYGVDCHARQGADIEMMLAELAHGHKVIAAVDSGELWKQDWFFEDWINSNGADHAVVVTGLDMRDPNHPMVILNDPGHPNGAGAAYPLNEFLNAWADSGQMFVATDSAPGDLASHSIFGHNFDPNTGTYMDLSFWTDFLASVLQAVTTVAEKYAINQATWNSSSQPVGNTMFDMWATLDDTARNNLFCII